MGCKAIISEIGSKAARDRPAHDLRNFLILGEGPWAFAIAIISWICKATVLRFFATWGPGRFKVSKIESRTAKDRGFC